MKMSDKSKQHVDSCRFCWMCHHVCPIGNATGQERCTARARAFGLSLVNREVFDLSDVIDNVYECATCGGCENFCVTGWRPVMFAKEARKIAAMEGKLPAYIQTLVKNCLETGNAYGKTECDAALKAEIAKHAKKTDTLLLLGADATYMVAEAGVNAIKALEKATAEFTVLEQEPATGSQLDFLVGAMGETQEQMKKAAAVLDGYKTVVVFDPADMKTLSHEYKDYGVELGCKVVSYTTFIAEKIKSGELAVKNTGMDVVYHDPFQLARDLSETEEPRAAISACANLSEMLLNRRDTNWAGSILMAQYMPQVMEKVAQERIRNAQCVNATKMVTASPAEYAMLKSVCPEGFEIISFESLILEATK